MRLEINVDADAFVVYTNKLEKLPDRFFPNVVRSTLNSLAFDVKKESMPMTSSKAFVNRQKNFFKANSRVEMARGSNITSMKSIVGFRSLGGKNTAIEDLEKQEFGGLIPGRSFIPLNAARTSKSPARVVSRKYRMRGIKNIVNVASTQGANDGQKFIKSVVKAGKGGFILKDDMLFFVNRLSRTGSQWRFRLTALYNYKKGRKVKIVRATHFMQKAVDITSKKAPKIYRKEAEKQYERALR